MKTRRNTKHGRATKQMRSTKHARRALFRQRSARRHTRKVLRGGKIFDGNVRNTANGGFKKDFMPDPEKTVLYMTKKDLVQKVIDYFAKQDNLTLSKVESYVQDDTFIRVKILPMNGASEKYKYEQALNKMKINDFLENQYNDPSELRLPSAAPVSAAPVSAARVSAAPVSAAPVSAARVRSAVPRFSSVVPGNVVNESSSDPVILKRQHDANTTIRFEFPLTNDQMENSRFMASNLLPDIQDYILQKSQTETFKKETDTNGLTRLPNNLQVVGRIDEKTKMLKIKLTSESFIKHPNLKNIVTVALLDLQFEDNFTIIKPRQRRLETVQNVYS